MDMGAYALPIMTVLGGALDYGSKIAAGRAGVQAAQRKQIGADYAADQLEVNAGQQEAAASYQVYDIAKKEQLGLSRVRALVAMQGGGSQDPSILGIQARINAEAGYREAMAIYQGQEAARGMRNQAVATRYMGDMEMADAKDNKKYSNLMAAGSLAGTGANLAGMSTMYAKYNTPMTAGAT